MKEFVEKLIERLEEQRGHICNCMPCNGCKYIGDCNEGEFAEDVALDKAIEIAKDLASEHNNGWISVEDALPEEYMDVLGYGQEGHTYLVRLYESKIFGKVWKQWNGGDMRFDWIIAWQPLPAPYKKGE